MNKGNFRALFNHVHGLTSHVFSHMFFLFHSDELTLRLLFLSVFLSFIIL